MMWDYRTSPKRHSLPVSRAFHAHQAAPQQHPHTCGRAPGQPAGRAPFPTNRHEGGSLT